MQFIKKVNGKLVGGPWPLTDDRTASPNNKWKAEQLSIHGYELVADPVVEKTDEQKKEELIESKKRELAVTALKAEGKLDGEGKLTPAGKSIAAVLALQNIDLGGY